MMTERDLANKMDAEQQRIMRIGKAVAVRSLSSMLKAMEKLFRDNRDPVIDFGLTKLIPILTEAMVAGHLMGVLRMRSAAPIVFSYKEALKFLRKKAKLSKAEITKLSEAYATEALHIVKKTTIAVRASLEQKVIQITTQNLHVREGVKALRSVFSTLGIMPRSDFLLETIFRTQTQIAYSAGQWVEGQETEELWGYKYFTVGDDRVRPEHAGFDEVTLPKNDEFWAVNFPPGGWNCRCQAIPIFEKRRKRNPRKIRGVEPVTDKGFQFNPGKLYQAIA